MKRDWIWMANCRLCGAPAETGRAAAEKRIAWKSTASVREWQIFAPMLCWACIVHFLWWWHPREEARRLQALPDYERYQKEFDSPWSDAWEDTNGESYRAAYGPFGLPSELDLAEWLAWVIRSRPPWYRKLQVAA